MAEVTETMTFEDAAQAISQGKRHLLVRDYSMAVTAFAQGCGMLAAQHGEMADELGEPFLLYGRSLLCLSREEAGVLGSCVPGNEEEEAEEGDGEEEEGEDEDESSKKDKEAEGEEAKPTKEESEQPASEAKPEEKMEDEPATATASAVTSTPAQNGEAVAGSSKSEKMMNGEASTSTAHLNGDSHQNGDDDGEDVDNDEDDDANSNLQLAWEVLELSKLILLKRGQPGWKLLAEAHRLLGEVAMESGNQPGALTDLNACLELLRRIEPADPRSMAETHYQLGLAYSLGNEFDSSIEQFKEATSLLETRIKDLEAITDPPKSDDPFYTIEGEIKELKELLPEIQDKITDMRDFKQQACKLVIEGIKSKVAGGSCSNGAGPSGVASSSSASSTSSAAVPKEVKPASDISHLVRKKRKTEDDDTEIASPCKKPTPEKCT